MLTFLACACWGGMSERIGRRWALMLPCAISILLVPIYLTTTDPTWFLASFLLFICFVGGKDALNPGWLSERYPTEVRATAAGFVYHQGAVWGAAVAPLLTYFAVNQGMGFAKPMMYGTIGSLVVYVIAVFLGPETKGKVMTADLEVIEVEVPAWQPGQVQRAGRSGHLSRSSQVRFRQGVCRKTLPREGLPFRTRTPCRPDCAAAARRRRSGRWPP